MQVPLGSRDVRVPQQSAGVLDPLLPANLRPAFVAGEVQHQIARKAGQVPEAGIRPAEVRDAPRLPRRGQEDRTFGAGPDCLIEQVAEFPTNRDAPGLLGLPDGLVLAQDDGVDPIHERELRRIVAVLDWGKQRRLWSVIRSAIRGI